MGKRRDQTGSWPEVDTGGDTDVGGREDISNTYEAHANCYITKPVDFEQFMNVVRSIQDFWVTVVQLPVKP